MKRRNDCDVLLINELFVIKYVIRHRQKYLQQIEDNACIITPHMTLVRIFTAKIASSSSDFGGNIYSKNSTIIYIINDKF